LLFFCGKVMAEDIKTKDAIRAIIGEASNQGYRGMLIVACAIRNRGTLKGVYGLNAKHVDAEPRTVWDTARCAWKASTHFDYSYGATLWASKICDKRWLHELETNPRYIKTVEYKDQVYFKERR